MDEDIKQRLLSSMDKVNEYLDSGSEFVAEQAPLVAQEIVAWHFWSGVIQASIGLFFTLILVIAYCVACRVIWTMEAEAFGDETSDRWGCTAVATLLLVLLMMAPSVIALEGSCNAIEASVAPRLVVLDYMSRFMP